MKIALISDTHLAPEAPAFGRNGQAVLAWIQALPADLVLHLGDITADGIKDAAHYRTAAELFAPLGDRIRFVPGNHDIGDNPGETHTGKEPTVDPERLALYRATFGDDRWVLSVDGWTLVGLNAQLFGSEDEEEEAQFAWLSRVLAEAAGPVGLVLHKPLFRETPDEAEIHHRYVPHAARRRLLAQFVRHDLRFVLSGHTHQTRRRHVAGIEHVWAPSTAFVIPDALQERIGEKVVGTMILTLTADSHRFDLVIPAGVIQHDLADHAEVYPQLAKMLSGPEQ